MLNYCIDLIMQYLTLHLLQIKYTLFDFKQQGDLGNKKNRQTKEEKN